MRRILSIVLSFCVLANSASLVMMFQSNASDSVTIVEEAGINDLNTKREIADKIIKEYSSNSKVLQPDALPETIRDQYIVIELGREDDAALEKINTALSQTDLNDRDCKFMPQDTDDIDSELNKIRKELFFFVLENNLPADFYEIGAVQNMDDHIVMEYYYKDQIVPDMIYKFMDDHNYDRELICLFVAESGDANQDGDSQATPNNYMSMSNDDVLKIRDLSEYSFGDDSIDDTVKFEKYLNKKPDIFEGDNWISPQYSAYKSYLSGKEKAYLTFYVDSDTELTEEITSDKLGFPDDWVINGIDGIIQIEAGIEPKKIHEYRLYIPNETITDFESYIKLDLASACYPMIVQNNPYGIISIAKTGAQFASMGEGTMYIQKVIGTPQENLQIIGDANQDGKVTLADALSILQYIANEEKYPLSESGLAAADCYNPGDGLTAMDALAIQKLDTGKIDSLPAFE